MECVDQHRHQTTTQRPSKKPKSKLGRFSVIFEANGNGDGTLITQQPRSDRDRGKNQTVEAEVLSMTTLVGRQRLNYQIHLVATMYQAIQTLVLSTMTEAKAKTKTKAKDEAKAKVEVEVEAEAEAHHEAKASPVVDQKTKDAPVWVRVRVQAPVTLVRVQSLDPCLNQRWIQEKSQCVTDLRNTRMPMTTAPSDELETTPKTPNGPATCTCCPTTAEETKVLARANTATEARTATESGFRTSPLTATQTIVLTGLTLKV